ncbi:5751_t:CDS:1 [Scutellospora calospora]|uniref:5751_t:CDS:1 n=1 Tax=Scutellospora calospora TaxID=85575 RepID=A0ACA9L8P1_9GLOM|nr:5751_t:CDS:1 [Scutellospora calospora]
MSDYVTKKNYFQYELPNEVMIYMFKFVKHPLNLMISCKRCSFICKDSQSKAEWIIFQFGRAHCLFNAIRLGPTFISVDVAQAIISKGGILSRYFAQRLIIHYGEYDQKLIELKISHNIGQTNIVGIQQNIIHWASNLPISVYIFLLTEASNQFKDKLCIKGNDLELFHLLTGGPHSINVASTILKRNKDDIIDLILHKKFIPFPPRNSDDRQINPIEEYPPKDGHENTRQLNIIARSILINKDLVHLWKKIGYFEICEDVNDLVIQGAILILFPPAQPLGWTKPSVKDVKERLDTLIDLGFQLNYNIIIDILHLFEHRLDDIGKILIDSFAEIKQETQECFLRRSLIETLRPNVNLKKPEISNFIYKHLPGNPETEFQKAVDNYKVLKIFNIDYNHRVANFQFDINIGE